MPQFFLAKHDKKLTETRDFLLHYLSRKERSDYECYLSFYFSKDSAASKSSREGRFVRLLREVESSLKSQLNSRTVKLFLEQINQLNPFDIISENRFSIAFFISEKFAGFLLLPFSVYETVVIAKSPHLKPVLSWLKTDDQFYLAMISSQKSILLKGNCSSLSEVCAVEAGAEDNAMLDLAAEEFTNIINETSLPLFLGGDTDLLAAFRSRCQYSNIFTESLNENIDKFTTEELHKECLSILNSIRIKRDLEMLLKYKNKNPEDKIVEDLKEIIVAAIQGRVQNLVVASDRFVWGSFDKATGKINRHINKNLAVPEDDILDDLAEIVIARGGTVTVLKHNDIPSDSDAIALLK